MPSCSFLQKKKKLSQNYPQRTVLVSRLTDKNVGPKITALTRWTKKAKRTGYSYRLNHFLYWKIWDPPPRVPYPGSLGFNRNTQNFHSQLWEMPWAYRARWRQLSANAGFTVWAKVLIPPLFPSCLFNSFLFFWSFFFGFSLLVFSIKKSQPQLHPTEVAKEMFWNNLLLVELFPTPDSD